jgi:hypothetical protein
LEGGYWLHRTGYRGIFAGADVIRLFGAKPFEDLVWTFS